MNGNSCLLDTSIIIHVFKGTSAIAEKLNAISEVYVPSIVVGELFYGAYRSSAPHKHINQINLFLHNCIILPIDNNTGEHYGRLKSALYDNGTPLPENDIWIAAVAHQYSLALFTTDKHFKDVKSITLV